MQVENFWKKLKKNRINRRCFFQLGTNIFLWIYLYLTEINEVEKNAFFSSYFLIILFLLWRCMEFKNREERKEGKKLVFLFSELKMLFKNYYLNFFFIFIFNYESKKDKSW